VSALLITSCSGTGSVSQPTNRWTYTEYKNQLNLYEQYLSEVGWEPWDGVITRWWQCFTYGSDSVRLQTEDPLQWKLFGYCLPIIDDTIYDYLQLNYYGDPTNSIVGQQKQKALRLNPNDQNGFKDICEEFTKNEIEEILPSTSEGKKSLKFITPAITESIISGCVLRFKDTMKIRIKEAKVGIKEEKARLKAIIQEEIQAEREIEANKPIDTNSREYITGLTIGNNFSDFSDAGSNAEDVCATARDRRIVLSSRGGVGVDPRTASFLNSKEGFQGCIDGFNGIPQD